MVLDASKVYIIHHLHVYIHQNILRRTKRPFITKKPVVIEDDIWVGESVVGMPNATIGKNSTISANPVSTKSFLQYTVIAGVSAKFN